jgi:hypothetical protein
MHTPFMNPLFRLIASHPNLLAVHAESYARMVADELGATSVRLQRRAFLGAGALIFLLIALIFGGVGLMLWGISVELRADTRWLLIAVPAVPLVLSVLFFVLLRSDPKQAAMAKVRTQFKADLAMLHETGAL